MKALVLVGGRATRLLPLTINTPKSLVPVINVPFMEHAIAHLKEHGILDIILAQGHLSKAIEAHLGDGRRFGVNIYHSYEDVPLGSAGAAKNAEKYLDDTFLVLNADIFSDLDFTAMLALHRAREARLTIATTPVDDPTRYGLVESGLDGRVRRFLEKPRREDVTTNMINAGAWFVEPGVMARVPAQTSCSFERNVFPQMLADGERVYAYPVGGYWIDMGTPETYLQLHRDLLRGKCRRYRMADGRQVSIGDDCTVDPAAEIKGVVVIGERCKVGARARIIGPAVIGPGTVVEDDSTVEDSVMWRNVHIARGATVCSSIIAADCRLAEGCVVEGSVLGDGVTVAKGMTVPPGSRLEPGTQFHMQTPDSAF